MQRMLGQGIPRQNILYLNFFDDRLHNLFFDEIQTIQGWESFIDRLQRTEKCEMFLTGSSAQMLSRESATQMRGRALSWELFPFSFREYLSAKKIKSAGPFSPAIFYFKTIAGHAVDFLAQLPDRSRKLIQICATFADPQTHKREITALAKAMTELELSEGLIITRQEEEVIESDLGTIRVKPAGRFLLEN